MATAKYADKRKEVLVGTLPDDFLRVSTSDPSSPTNVSSTALATQANEHANFTRNSGMQQITICIVQAQLTKNYSLTKMDPYVRVRIGHSVFETHADGRGGKFPNWNKTICAYLPPGIKSIYLEIFDERTITPDERIAFAEHKLPDEALQGKFMDTWIPLSGKQGEGKEGSINITVYITPVPFPPRVMPAATPIMVIPPAVAQVPYYMPAQSVVQYPIGQQPMPYSYPVMPQQQYRPAPTEEDIKQLQDMFPAYDREVILGVLESNGGNKDQAITTLLSMSDK